LNKVKRYTFRRQAWGIILIVLLGSFRTEAQISQPAQYEREHKGSDHEFIVISMNETGIALVRDTEKFEDGKKSWEVIILDTLLNETWSTKIDIEQRMNILGHDFRDGNAYLIFKNAESAGHPLQLVELNLREKRVRQHAFKPEVSIQFTHFSILKNKAIFGGYILKEPTLLLYDLDSEGAKVVPGIFQPNTQLIDVRTNSNDTFNALLTERQSNSAKKLVARTYDANGVMLVEDIIAIDEGKTILEGMTSSLVHDELAVMGTWTYGANKEPAGIFSVLVDPFTEQKVNYYDFAELNHFLDYLRPKRIARIKAKAEWRRSAGKHPEFRTHVSPIRMEESKTGFSLLTEVYEPSTTYNSRYNSPYGYNPYGYSPYGYYPYSFNSMPYRYYNSPYGYGPYNSYPTTLPDTRIIHSSLLFFDQQGRLLSDQSLKYPEIKLGSREQVSDFIRFEDRTFMACKEEEEIIARVNGQDGSVIKEEKIKLALKDPAETIRSESQENSFIRFWYGRCFYVYGYHTVRGGEGKTRDVFYVNKVNVE
jgi:hypothetical protein